MLFYSREWAIIHAITSKLVKENNVMAITSRAIKAANVSYG